MQHAQVRLTDLGMITPVAPLVAVLSVGYAISRGRRLNIEPNARPVTLHARRAPAQVRATVSRVRLASITELDLSLEDGAKSVR